MKHHEQIEHKYPEEWKTVPGYEKSYAVSNLGRVMALEKIDCLGRKRKEKLLKPSMGSRGYVKVTLYKNTKRKVVLIHRLVMWVFVKELPKGMKKMQVNHINGVKTDNTLANLEIVSPCQNAAHARESGLTQAYNKGSSNLYAKKIVCFSASGLLTEFGAIKEAGKCLGVCHQNISDTLRGNRKQAGGFKWAYLQ